MADTSSSHRTSRGFINVVASLAFHFLPVAFLAGVIGLFLTTNQGDLHNAEVGSGENLSFESTVLQPGQFDLTVRNLGSKDITITTVNINDSILPFIMEPKRPIPHLGQATIHVQYPWVKGEAYRIALLTSDSTSFDTTISAAEQTRLPDLNTLADMTRIGLYAGILAMVCGITWFPALRWSGEGTLIFPLAVTVGLLIYLSVAALNLALTSVQPLSGAFQGTELVAVGTVPTFLLLDALSSRKTRAGTGGARPVRAKAWRMGLWICLQNLGEGLAIGAALSLGARALGLLLAIGLIVQNVTGGGRLIAPVVGHRPKVLTLMLSGIAGGVAAVFGVWIGSFTGIQPLTILYLSIGAGAMIASAYEAYKLIRRITVEEEKPWVIFAGTTLGMLAFYAAGLMLM